MADPTPPLRHTPESMSTTPVTVTITPRRQAPIDVEQIRQSLSDLIRELEHLQARAEYIERALEPLLLEADQEVG